MCVCCCCFRQFPFLVDTSRVFGVKTTGVSAAHSEMGGLAVAVGRLVCSTGRAFCR